MTCEICRFWLIEKEVAKDDRLNERGFCRRYPPALVPENLDNKVAQELISWARNGNAVKYLEYHRVFPKTDRIDWCGEFKSK